MNQKQGKRSSRKATYYDHQFARTTQNKNRAAARIVRRKTAIPKPVGWQETFVFKQLRRRAARIARRDAAHNALREKMQKSKEGVLV